MKSKYVKSKRKPYMKKRNLYRKKIKNFGSAVSVYNFKRSISDNTGIYEKITLPITAGTISVPVYAYQFRLSDLPAYPEFITLFREYKLCAIRIDFTLNATSAYPDPAVTLPILHYAVDYLDANTVPLSQLQQYSTYKKHNFDNGKYRKCSVYFKPRVLNTVYGDSLTSAYSVAMPPWMSISYGSTIHYGLKFAIEYEDTAGFGFVVNPKATYYFKCRMLG
jgi:hypothetical protein